VGWFPEALRACEALRAPADEPEHRLAAAEQLRAYFVRGDLGSRDIGGRRGLSSRLFMQHRVEFITAALDAMVASAGEPSHVQRGVLGLIIAMEPALVGEDERQRLQQQAQGGGGGFAFGGVAAPTPVQQPNQYGTHVMEMLGPMMEPGSWGCLLGVLGAPLTGEDAERCADRAAHLLAALASPMLAAESDVKCEAMLCGWAEQLPMLLACFERACLRPPRAEHEHGAVLCALRTEPYQQSDPDPTQGLAFGGMHGWGDPILLWRGIGSSGDAVAARQAGFGGFRRRHRRYSVSDPPVWPGLGEQLSLRLGTPAAPTHFAWNIGTVLQTLLLAPPPPGGLVPGGAQALHQAVRRAALRVLRHTLGQIDVCLAMLRAEARTAANSSLRTAEAGGGGGLQARVQHLGGAMGARLAVQLLESGLAVPGGRAALRGDGGVSALLQLVAAPGRLQPVAAWCRGLDRGGDAPEPPVYGGIAAAAVNLQGVGAGVADLMQARQHGLNGLVEAGVRAAEVLHAHFDVDVEAEVGHIESKRLLRARQLLAFVTGTAAAAAGGDGGAVPLLLPCNHGATYDVLRFVAAALQLPSVDTVGRAASQLEAAAAETAQVRDEGGDWATRVLTAARARLERLGAEATVEDVAAWVGAMGLCAEAQVFRAQEIDGAALPELTDQDLLLIGVARMGRRKLLRREIAKLRIM
jgi:hypothetical protein